ncbi:cytochrome [Frankia sp. CcI49]|uniref:cytochrome P450 n=1 Tax=Frankia sp. CcI49 TaxID=1745382 RepID=UPI0009772324|nr:cytochrome P450 [Frankia sp. CcI49]ONH51684.1 cytochrome [Frankia sp. CcI49]
MTTVGVAGTSEEGTAAIMEAVTATRLPDPYPRYRQIRERGAFITGEIGGRSATLVTRLAEASAVLSHSAAGHGFSDGINYRAGMRDGLGSLLRADPPDHTRLRRLVGRAFTPAVIESLAAEVTSLANELLDEALERAEIDAVTAFARPLPLRTICRLLGVPAADEEEFGGWADALTRGLDPYYLLTEEEQATCHRAGKAFDAYFVDLIARRRAAPQDDLLSRLVALHDDGDVLSERELLELCALLLVAGYETTANLIASGVLALVRNPDQLAALRADPGLVGSAVEEMIRYEAPVQFVARTFLTDAEIAGRSFARGDGAILMLGAANRDPEAFEDPDRFLAARYTGSARTRRHLGLGVGIHYCLGAPLARMEAEIAFRVLLSRTRSFVLAAETLAYRPQIVVRGLSELPLRLSA